MKKTTKKISAAALAVVMGVTAFTGCSDSAGGATSGNNSTESTTATGSQKIMTSNEDVKSAVDNVSVAEDYKNIKVDTYDGLLVDYAKQKNAVAIVKGLRAMSDFEYEFQQALTNKSLYPKVETVFLTTEGKNMFLSSSIENVKLPFTLSDINFMLSLSSCFFFSISCTAI